MEKVKNNITEMVFILDRSGSMHGLEKDTIGGFNSMIDKQKELDGECYVSTVLFDSETEVLHDRRKLSHVNKITDKDYYVRGSTALLDAVGGAIKHIGNIHKYARREDVPGKTIFVIITDGMENASRKYSGSDVKRMIERQKEKYGWEFLFLGANIDAGFEAEKIGIERNRSVNYSATCAGTSKLYSVVNETVKNYRERACIDENWSERIK